MTETLLISHLDQATYKEQTNLIPATSVILFDGDSFLAFEFAENSTVGKRWGIPGGHNEHDFKTGGFESGRKTGPREVKEETNISIKPENLNGFDGNVFVKDMSKNRVPKVMEWTVFYSHVYSGEPRHVQPEEGKPEWIKIQDFFNLPDEEVAPNAKLALLYATIHSART